MASAKLIQPDQGKIKFTSQLISNFNNNNNDKQLKKTVSIPTACIFYFNL